MTETGQKSLINLGCYEPKAAQSKCREGGNETSLKWVNPQKSWLLSCFLKMPGETCNGVWSCLLARTVAPNGKVKLNRKNRKAWCSATWGHLPAQLTRSALKVLALLLHPFRCEERTGLGWNLLPSAINVSDQRRIRCYKGSSSLTMYVCELYKLLFCHKKQYLQITSWLVNLCATPGDRAYQNSTPLFSVAQQFFLCALEGLSLVNSLLLVV